MKLTCVLLMIAVVGCAGTQIRDNVLMPLAEQVFDHIYPQIEMGLIDAVKDGDLTSEAADLLRDEADKLKGILKNGNRSRLSEIDWRGLECWASRGVQTMIDDRTISPGVATSLFQRIVNFRDMLLELTGKVVWNSSRPIYSTDKTVGGGPTFLGYAPKLDINWTALEHHNRPRRALGLPEISWSAIE